MGKKGKKKAKVTGTPDVQKFKGTREYWLMHECYLIQESLPFVAGDRLEEVDIRKVSRFLNMIGLLGEHLQVGLKKDYRFNFHHKYLAPTPQFFPFGYDMDTIMQARQVQSKESVTYNETDYSYDPELKVASEEFLKACDSNFTRIASEIEQAIRADFSSGLKKFKVELRQTLELYDEMWVQYEMDYLKERQQILSKVFEPIDKLVTLEMMLSNAEERLDIELKQALENKLIEDVEGITNTLVPETAKHEFPRDVIPLAEACIFYESKCTEEWLHNTKWLIKDYMELRLYIAKIPEDRMNPELKENAVFVRLLKRFHESVLEARGALDFVSRLPKLIHAKTSSNWMTKKLLEPDLRYIQKTAHLAMEHS